MTEITNQNRKWHLLDMSSQSYGRVLTQAANLLSGKLKTNYAPNLDQGDYVVIINAQKAIFTGRKIDQKMYYKHTSYLGNLKSISAKELFAKDPESMIIKSVAGMLPKNKLQKERLSRLKIYRDNIHPHQNVKFEE